MSTPFEKIYKKFENKMLSFKGYFDIGGADLDLIQLRNKMILMEAIDQLQPKIAKGQNVDFYDNDEEIEFNFDLTPFEISLLSDMMVLVAIEEESATLIETQLVLSSDAKSWSPNEGRNSFMSMWKEREIRFENRLQTYNTYDRLSKEIIPDYDYSSTNLEEDEEE